MARLRIEVAMATHEFAYPDQRVESYAARVTWVPERGSKHIPNVVAYGFDEDRDEAIRKAVAEARSERHWRRTRRVS